MASTALMALALAACATASPAPASPPTPVLPAPVNPVGVYDCSVMIEDQELRAVLTIESAEGAYRGTMAGDMGTMPVQAITVDGNDMTFSVVTPDFSVDFWVTFEGDSFGGEFEAGDMGVGTITATRR